MLSRVFGKCRPSSYELHIRSADDLTAAENPEPAGLILNSAMENLNTPQNAESFYQLGRIFQNKASFVFFDTRKYDTWLNYALEAYRQAVKLDPRQERYLLSEAGILAHQGKYEEMNKTLTQARSLAEADHLSDYLQANARAGVPFKLKKVCFSVQGVNCSCHLSKLETTLEKSNGVAFASISRLQPYTGVILLAESSPVSGVFAECHKSFDPGPQTKTPELFSFEVISEHLLRGAEEAVRVAQNARFGEAAQFYTPLSVAAPVLPLPTGYEPSISIKP